MSPLEWLLLLLLPLAWFHTDVARWLVIAAVLVLFCVLGRAIRRALE